MKLDRNALSRLISLDDTQLKGVIETIAAESGIDIKSLGISGSDIASIRKALEGATEEDLKTAQNKLDEYKNRRGL
ncbi:MAG: hypothetical protein IJ303_06255 [Clostridia bacterium]|nr:hypothetical protein [Clostridia bacterium]